jgi:hypothetical protein
VVGFTRRPLYPQGKSHRYLLDRRLGVLLSCSGLGGKEKNSQPLPGIKPYNPDRPAYSLVTIPIELSRLFAFVSGMRNTCSILFGNVDVDGLY